MISEQHIFDIIQRHLPAFKASGELERISDGNLNHVWRLRGKEKNLIIKWAPPHIAANPEVPLSPKRIHFEAKALHLFERDNMLSLLASDNVRPPELLHFEEEADLLIMEDMGSQPSIAEWIINGGDGKVGTRLGRFIGKLHNCTLNTPALQQQFNNHDIQQTRLNVQYSPAADYLWKTGLRDVDSNLVSEKTKALGQELLEPGRCLVMGDLWPPSVLVDSGKLWLIDWEFAHYGRPLQDIGHFAAHCWMQSHMASSREQSESFKKLWNRFWTAYRQTLDEDCDNLLSDDETELMAIHAGAEILVRAAGPFKEGYVYGSLTAEDKAVREAGQQAVQLILDGNFSKLWVW